MKTFFQNIIFLLNFGLFFSVHFGIVKVDFNDPQRTRTPKASFTFFKNVISNRKLA